MRTMGASQKLQKNRVNRCCDLFLFPPPLFKTSLWSGTTSHVDVILMIPQDVLFGISEHASSRGERPDSCACGCRCGGALESHYAVVVCKLFHVQDQRRLKLDHRPQFDKILPKGPLSDKIIIFRCLITQHVKYPWVKIIIHSLCGCSVNKWFPFLLGTPKNPPRRPLGSSDPQV